ncbi:Phosphatidylserine synthase [gut metagenome]|uniref:Phosphatidylserine synthase n=1 Tax=gut metagenome TaxID=749906 RepID=J9G5X1_9ZZZZ
MLGFYDYTVVLTYISLGISIVGMFQALQGNFKIAIFCLALSGLCDMFDGKIARTKKNRTEDEKKFGIQIDSLCDVVCFGIFPIIICYCLGMHSLVSMSILVLYGVASVIRLGYFNVTEEKRQNDTEELRPFLSGTAYYLHGHCASLPLPSPPLLWDPLYFHPPCSCGDRRGAVYQ